MNSRWTGLLALFLLSACGRSENVTESPPADVAATPIFDMPYVMRELDNGLRVIVVPTDFPDIVTLRTSVQTGVRNEVEEGRSGFAHFFEHMMFRGTEAYSSERYSAALKKAGASSNAFTTDDYTGYYITFTNADLEKMIELEADRFRNLSYSEADFRTEALAVKGEYLKDYSDPLLKAFERIRDLSFDLHPYSHTSIGLVEDIDAMPDQLDYSREFFDRWYRPEYTSVVVVGDVDPDATLALVQKYWGGWERGSYIADIPEEPPGAGPRYEHVQWESETQPWVLIGFRSPAFDAAEKDFPAMSVISQIYFSDSSDLYQDLVIDRQLADFVGTDFPLNKNPNLNLVYARLTDAAHAADVEAAVLETLARARTELIAPDKLAQTQSRLRYAFSANLDNSDDIGSMLDDYVQIDRTPETINEFYATFDTLTPEDVRGMADRYFTDATRATVSLSASSSLPGLASARSLDDMAASRVAPETAPAPASTNEDVDEEVFDTSGDPAPLALVAIPSGSSPLVDVSIIVHSGAAMDPEGKKGLAALTAAMITDGGSATWSIQEINEAMYPIASEFGAQVDKEMTRLSGQVHRDNLDTWYRYVRSQLLNPGWQEQDFTRIRTQLVNSIRTDLVGDNDEEVGKERLYADIFGSGHPYGSLNLGHSADLESLTLDDVKAFYAAHYTVRNLTVGVSGGYPDAFVTRLSNDLQSLPAGERQSLTLPELSAIDGNRVTIIEKETPAVAVSFGYPIDVARGDPDWVALWLVRSWLGEHRSDSGRLYQRIRAARGLNYGDYAYIEYFPQGMDQMRPGTNLGRRQQIFQVWIRPLRDNNDAHFATRAAVFEMSRLIEEGMSETDFEATRAFLANSVSLLTDGQSRRLGYAIDSEYYGIPAFPEYVREALSDLTLADVNRVIREKLRTEDMQFVFVTRDAGDLAARLADDAASPMRYDAEQPAELLAEDLAIGAVSLGVDPERITIVPAAEVFH
jgi:zinc protease